VVLTQTASLLNHLKPLLCYVMLCKHGYFDVKLNSNLGFLFDRVVYVIAICFPMWHILRKKISG